MDYNPFGYRTLGRTPGVTPGTAYAAFVEPMGANVMTTLQTVLVTNGSTAQTLTIMRPLSAQALPGSSGSRCSAYLTAAALGAQKVIALNQDPGVFTAYTYPGGATPRTANLPIATNHYVAYQYPDGSWEFQLVASVSSLNVTLTTNLGTGGLAINAPVWFFGLPASTNPYDGQAHPVFTLAASVVTTLGGAEVLPFFTTFGLGEPLLLVINNATANSTLERVTACYIARGGPFASYA